MVTTGLPIKQPHTNHAPQSAGFFVKRDIRPMLISFAASYPYKATQTMLLIL